MKRLAPLIIGLGALVLAGCASIPQIRNQKEINSETQIFENLKYISEESNGVVFYERDGRGYYLYMKNSKSSGFDPANLAGYYRKDLEGNLEYVKLSSIDKDYSTNPEISGYGRITGIDILRRGVFQEPTGLLIQDYEGNLYKISIGEPSKENPSRKSAEFEGEFTYNKN